MHMNTRYKISIFFLLAFIIGLNPFLIGQCENWNDSPKKDEGENAHTIYRDALKAKDYEIAFENWQIAYEIAPTADGLRDFHYVDGIILYLDKLKKEADEEKKKEYKTIINTLYDQAISCYEARAIKMKNSSDESYNAKLGYMYGRKAFDMFYNLNVPYAANLVALSKAVELGGLNTEYIVFDPYATIAVWEFEKERMTKEEARDIHIALNAIADHNIETNERYSDYYDQAKQRMNSIFSKIERDIFDCPYFIEKFKPEYEADPDNPDVIKKVIGILKGGGCEAGDPFYDELDAKWKVYAAVENVRLQEEYFKENPNMHAKDCYDKGDYKCAVNKYKEAIEKEIDPEKKAKYYFSLASIQFRKLGKYGEARSNAYKAASLKPNWGRPYILIGDMYGKAARDCGDSWNQRLAILAAMDKYNYAKSIDSSVSSESNSRISKYRSSMPSQDEGFMRGVKAGQKVKVDCWIAEKVKVRYN